MKKGFTLMELIIVIGLIALLAVAAVMLLNPVSQIHKSWDGKRKAELSALQKVLEDWYGDKNCYPKPAEICYNDSSTPDADGTYSCNICGKAETIRSLSPYVSQLLCDPQYPSKKYLYQTDKNDCPTWYRIYTELSGSGDPAITEAGCTGGCGPSFDTAYNYGVSSPNVGLESVSTTCMTAGTCESYCTTIGKTCVNDLRKYDDSSCQNSNGGICNGPNCCTTEIVGGGTLSFICVCR